MDKNVIYNEDCLLTMQKIGGVNVVLTSPPYNTSNRAIGGNSMATLLNSKVNKEHYPCSRYDVYLDNMTQEEYIGWTIQIFDGFNKVLAKNGVVLYNISYSSSNRNTMFLLIADIIRKSNFGIADWIGWKKDCALPNNTSPNKLTRIFEPIYVFARKSEMDTFQCNKEKSSVIERTGQQLYCNVQNFIEAPNNDGVCELNRATYSTKLCEKLLKIYGRRGDLVYDPFMGTGTTAVACKRLGMDYLGSEISAGQVAYAKERIMLEGKEYVKHGKTFEVMDNLFGE